MSEEIAHMNEIIIRVVNVHCFSMAHKCGGIFSGMEGSITEAALGIFVQDVRNPCTS